MIEEAEAMIERLEFADKHGLFEAANADMAPHFGEAAAMMQRLVDGLNGQGECICPKCGIRHGGSHFPRGDF